MDSFWFRPRPGGGPAHNRHETHPVPGQTQPANTVTKPARIVTPIHPDQTYSGDHRPFISQQEPQPLAPGPQTGLAGVPGYEGTWIVKAVQEPEYTFRGNLAVPTTTAPSTIILLQPLATGILRCIRTVGSNLSLTNTANLTITLQSSYGEIYLQTVVELISSAISYINLMDLENLNVTFKNGLNLVLSTTNADSGNTGWVSVNGVWKQ